MVDNLPPGMSQRDLDHVEGTSSEARCTCGCAFEEHYPDGDGEFFPCSNCKDCPDYTPEEDPRYG